MYVCICTPIYSFLGQVDSDGFIWRTSNRCWMDPSQYQIKNFFSVVYKFSTVLREKCIEYYQGQIQPNIYLRARGPRFHAEFYRWHAI